MSRYVVMAGWDDVPHLSERDKADMMASLPPHQRESRMKGIPSMGAGAIYPVPEEDVFVKPFQIPYFWPRAYGLDVGWKKTAAVWGAWDRDNDIIYAYSEHYRGQAEPAVHASAIQTRGKWIRGAIDPAGTNITDGTRVMELYQKLGLDIVKADKSVEAGLLEVYQRLSTGRLKIFTTLENLRAEYRLYRRDDKGKVVKQNDHLLDALRYLVMMIHMIASLPPVQRPAVRPAIGDTTIGY